MQDSRSPVAWVGVGCQRGTSAHLIAYGVDSAIDLALQRAACSDGGAVVIAAIATLDLKTTEAGLLEFCHHRHLPLRGFTAEQLAAISRIHCAIGHSARVAEAMHTPSVAEAAAILACQTWGEECQGLWLPKQIVRRPGYVGTMTVAIARSGER
jgi:cobalamin biosynthesis protein CbiG